MPLNALKCLRIMAWLWHKLSVRSSSRHLPHNDRLSWVQRASIPMDIVGIQVLCDQYLLKERRPHTPAQGSMRQIAPTKENISIGAAVVHQALPISVPDNGDLFRHHDCLLSSARIDLHANPLAIPKVSRLHPGKLHQDHPTDLSQRIHSLTIKSMDSPFGPAPIHESIPLLLGCACC